MPNTRETKACRKRNNGTKRLERIGSLWYKWRKIDLFPFIYYPKRVSIVNAAKIFFHISSFLLFQRCVVVQEVYPDGLISQDGRLQPGDQIIEINGSDMTCATHAEVSSKYMQWSGFPDHCDSQEWSPVPISTYPIGVRGILSLQMVSVSLVAIRSVWFEGHPQNAFPKSTSSLSVRQTGSSNKLFVKFTSKGKWRAVSGEKFWVKKHCN